MSQSTVQAKTCAQCVGYDSSQKACRSKPYDYFWGIANMIPVDPNDDACWLFKRVELTYWPRMFLLGKLSELPSIKLCRELN
jgi:hypothetical protein